MRASVASACEKATAQEMRKARERARPVCAARAVRGAAQYGALWTPARSSA